MTSILQSLGDVRHRLSAARISAVSVGWICIILAVVLATDGWARTPNFAEAFHAVRVNRTALLRETLQAGLGTSIDDLSFGATLLGEAVKRRNYDAVRVLLGHGANPNLAANPAKSRVTPLMLISQDRSRSYDVGAIAETLLQNKANPDLVDEKGWTALMYAAQSGNLRVMEFLLRYDANPKVRAGVDSASSLVSGPDSGSMAREIRLAIERRRPSPTPAQEAARRRIKENDMAFTASGLGQAIMLGQMDRVELFIAAGLDLEDADNEYVSPLATAAGAGQVGMVKRLIDAGAGKTPLRGKAYTAMSIALTHAANIGHLELVRLLLDHGADPNAPVWVSALGFAAQSGQVAVVELLLTRGADINAITGRMSGGDEKTTPLSMAVNAGRTQVVSLLLDRGAQSSSLDKHFAGYNLLQLAAFHGHTDTVRLLLDRGFKIETRTARGETPLFVAAGSGHLETTRLLLERGADVHNRNTAGLTALDVAAGADAVQVIALLRAHGAPWSNSSLELGHAVATGDLEKVRALLKAGANPDFVQPGHEGKVSKPLLLVAVENQNVEIVRALLEKAHPNPMSKEGVSPLVKAAQLNHLGLVTLLLDKGADPNRRPTEEGWESGYSFVPPLHHAAVNGNDEMVGLFLSRRADVNGHSHVVAEGSGGTALLWAVAKNRVSTAKQLIARGANVNLTSYTETSPLELAKRNRHHELISLLQRAGAKDRPRQVDGE